MEQRLGWTPGPTVTLKLVSPPFPLLPELFVLRSLPPSLIWPLRKTGPGLRLLLASGGSHGVWGLLILPPSACARRPLCDRKLTSYYPMIPSLTSPPCSGSCYLLQPAVLILGGLLDLVMSSFQCLAWGRWPLRPDSEPNLSLRPFSSQVVTI